MTDNPSEYEVLLKAYEQLKAETRIALDVYGKVYSSLVAVAGIAAGVATSANTDPEQQGLLFAIISVVMLGILGVVWYGHQVALARLSKRLELVEYHLNALVGKPSLLEWQRWDSIGRRWQKVLAIVAMLPSGFIYCVAAEGADSWWAAFLTRKLPGSFAVPKGLPLTLSLGALGIFFVFHHLIYAGAR